MKYGCFLLVCVFLLLSSLVRGWAVEAGTAPTTQSVLAEYREFAKMAGRVLHEEPTLVQNPIFDQKMTLKYQRYAGSQEVTQLKMIFSVAPEAVKLEQLAKAYVKYGREATSLSDELPVYVRGHIAMITDADYAASYRRRYREVVKTMFTGADGRLQEFKVFDCDYTTQPTDALWYLEHSLELLDRYGTARFGEAWVAKREELRKANQIRSPEEMRAAFEIGLKEGDAKHPGSSPAEESPENSSAD